MNKFLFSFIAFFPVCAAQAVLDTDLPYADGPYKPDWDSLASQYQTPEWFKDAKFGLWAHWNIQCVPGTGGWSAMFLYGPHKEGNKWFNDRSAKCSAFHREHYGHPSEVGAKDYIPGFTAENWNPDKLMELYKAAGARYFVALANHHDNFDNWNSKHQPWNAVNMGPKRDLVGDWAKAARKQGLKFGVSVHAARTWKWYVPAFGSDTDGPMKGVPYDGNMTKADGKGKWWEGYDPADLYTRPHKEGDPEDQAYVDRFYLRTLDLIDQYHPDLLYFDDYQSPLGNTGLRIYADYYNSSLKWNNEKMEVVINSKMNDEKTRRAVVEDVERGGKAGIYPSPWQTDTCIGGWDYNLDYANGASTYKTPETVVRMLIDIVSKNGNLLLNIPLRPDGTPDDYGIWFLKEMAKWMAVNGEGIYGTRPWKVFGEGPTNTDGGHMAETTTENYNAEDFRFTTKGGVLYVFAMTVPEGDLLVKSLAKGSIEISTVELLGSGKAVQWEQTDAGLLIRKLPEYPTKYAVCFRVRQGSAQ